MSALTSLLVRDEVVSVRQIEDALARQVLEGGELDTALLELDALAENVLNAYCAASVRLPAASREDVMAASGAALALIPDELAVRHRAIPITHDSTTLVVARDQPLPEAGQRELEQASGMHIECCIACEVRIDAALAQFYGRAMTPRMERLAARIEQLDPGILPRVEPTSETPISGLAAALFDGLDEADEAPAAAGATPIAYESLRPPTPPERVSMGHVVEVRPSQLGARPSDSPLLRLSDPPRRSSAAGRDTERGIGTSSIPAPDSNLQPAAAIVPPPAEVPKDVAPVPGDRGAVEPPTARSPRVANDVAKPRTGRAGVVKAKRAAVPQGPLTRELAVQLLERADDRDAVVEVFFRYARQYFDATALCSVREDRVLGREVHNVPNLADIRDLSLTVVRGSALEEVVRTLQPKVADLARKAEDLPLAEALTRTLCQPSCLLPLCIQRRVVGFVYGDRGGEYFRQQDLAPLIELLPEVSRSFERIIRTRKVLGLSARARSLAHAAAELGHAATQLDVVAASPARESAEDHEKTEALLRNARRALSALGVPRTAPPPPAAAARLGAPTRASTAAFDARAFAAPPRPASGPGDGWSALENAGSAGRELPPVRSRAEIEELERIPTARLPAVTEPEIPDEPDPAYKSDPVPRPPAYMSKPPPGAGRYSSVREGEGDEPELEEESDTRRLRKRSNAGSTGQSSDGRRRRSSYPKASATLDETESLEAPRFASPVPDPRVTPRPSKPPPGTGVYRQQDVMSEVISLAPSPARRSSQPTGARRSPPPAQQPRRSQPPRTSSSQPPTHPAGKRSSKPPREAPEARDDTAVSVPSSEFVPQAKTARTEAVPSVIVDTAGQTRALIDDLCSCGPDDEGSIVQSLLHVGDEALDLLLERFPGPLWFDRRRPYARLPFGRDTGPIARALAAFGEPVFPRLVPLMRSSSADVRYYATLFATDQVHADLLLPIAERLFDEDPQIRLMVRDALPAYQKQPAFAQVLASLRTRMLETRAPLSARLAAIDGAAFLRDGASVPALVELLANPDRQLSVPAHRALVAITCQDFGSSTKKWRVWYEDNQHRHRVQWLIDSLMHGEQNLRSAAGIELQKVTQVYYGYVASAPKRDRERTQKRYQDWWDIEGRKRV